MNFYWKLPYPEEVVLPNGFKYRYDATTDDPYIHIGAMAGKTFSWAQEPAQVIEACERNMDTAVIINEYRKDFTGREFLEYIKGSKPRTNHIGMYFS